jgi:hypothetical protein
MASRMCFGRSVRAGDFSTRLGASDDACAILCPERGKAHASRSGPCG